MPTGAQQYFDRFGPGWKAEGAKLEDTIHAVEGTLAHGVQVVEQCLDALAAAMVPVLRAQPGEEFLSKYMEQRDVIQRSMEGAWGAGTASEVKFAAMQESTSEAQLRADFAPVLQELQYAASRMGAAFELVVEFDHLPLLESASAERDALVRAQFHAAQEYLNVLNLVVCYNAGAQIASPELVDWFKEELVSAGDLLLDLATEAWHMRVADPYAWQGDIPLAVGDD